MNYFTRLGLDTDYNVSADKLEAKYIECQQRYHPDKFINMPEEERLKSMKITIEINQAYNILKSDIKRAEYILALHGIAIDDEAGCFKANNEILQNTMEERQILEDTQDHEELKSLLKDTQEQINHVITMFKKNLYENNIIQAANEVVKLRYKNKFLEAIECKLYE